MLYDSENNISEVGVSFSQTPYFQIDRDKD